MSNEEVEFSGTITAVTSDGRCGVVKLSQTVDGFDFAVIQPQTTGRIDLMNAGKGMLQSGTRVTGAAVPGNDALKARRIWPTPMPVS